MHVKPIAVFLVESASYAKKWSMPSGLSTGEAK